MTIKTITTNNKMIEVETTNYKNNYNKGNNFIQQQYLEQHQKQPH